MKLYTQTSGAGPDLVLIHGWGLHSGVWDNFVPLLEPHFRVTRVDLPGHGRSAWHGQASLDEMTDALLSAAPDSGAWLGWSLGGLLAARAALGAPGRVTALVLMASTPCFVRKPGWQAAMPVEVLDTFAAELALDYSRTLQRFLSLQVRGSEAAGDVLRELRARLLEHGQPAQAALQAGLQILRSADLRMALDAIGCPVLLLTGERDTLVPAAAGAQVAQLLHNATVAEVPGAGHAPFIARPRRVADSVRQFLQQTAIAHSDARHG